MGEEEGLIYQNVFAILVMTVRSELFGDRYNRLERGRIWVKNDQKQEYIQTFNCQRGVLTPKTPLADATAYNLQKHYNTCITPKKH